MTTISHNRGGNMRLNPNHPVIQETEDHWYKIAALLVAKLNRNPVIITPEDIAKLEGMAITIRTDDNVGIILGLVTMEEGERLARQEGGLPA